MKIVSGLVRVVLALVVAFASVWSVLFLSFHLALPAPWQTIVLWTLTIAGALAALAQFTRWRGRAFLLVALVTAGLAGWFAMLTPKLEADWKPSAARTVTGKLDGDILTLENVRNFTWQTPDTAIERWETRTYDLSKLEAVDLFMEHWSGPLIAHTVISFAFAGGDHLAWSIEVRYRNGQTYSPLAGLFRTSEIIFIAGDERDVIRRGVGVDQEDVYLYRLRMPPERGRELLMTYVEDANALAKTAEFYNTLTTNCTTVIVRMVRAIGIPFPIDWRVIVNGYLPELIHEKGGMRSTLPFPELQAAAAITAKAKPFLDDPDFPQRIREGMPGM